MKNRRPPKPFRSMTFEEDLTKRRIDVAAFAAGDAARYAEWQRMYAQMHPNSFYLSVKMVINDVRRRFWLAEAVKPAAPAAAATAGPARPAGRRAAISGATAAPIPAGQAIPEPATSPGPDKLQPMPAPAPEKPAAPAAPGRGRAVIRRPAAPAAEAISDVPASPSPAPSPVPETLPADSPAAAPEVPKPPRPRPVFKKPAAPETAAGETQAVPKTETPATRPGIAAQTGKNDALPVHTNPDPTEITPEAPKPPRPRPVFKRPASASPEPPAHLNQEGDQNPVIPAKEAQPANPQVPDESALPPAVKLPPTRPPEE